MVAETVKRLHRSAGAFHWRHTVLGLEIVLLAAAACAPLGTWDSVVNVAVSFVCALQVEAFRKVHGHAFASTMCTGNLRSGTEALYRCVSEQAPGSLRTAGCYFAVIACFLCGAALGGVLLPFWASGRCWWPLRSRPWCLCGCGFDKIKKVSEKSFRNLNCVV